MSFLLPLAGSIISGIISNNAAKAQQASAQQGAADLATQTFNQQVQYVQQQEQAQRDAIAKIAGQGNPFMQASGFLRPPNPNQYGLPPASGQLYRGGSGTPAMQAPQLAPLPQAQQAPQAPAQSAASSGTGIGTDRPPVTPPASQAPGATTGWKWDGTEWVPDTYGGTGAPGPNPSYGYSLQGGQPNYTFNGDSGFPKSVNGPTLSAAEAAWTSQYGSPSSPPQGTLGGAPAPGALAPQPRFNPLRPPTPRFVQ